MGGFLSCGMGKTLGQLMTELDVGRDTRYSACAGLRNQRCSSSHLTAQCAR